MKTKLTITVMLMSILIGALEASAQSARRERGREDHRKASTQVSRKSERQTHYRKEHDTRNRSSKTSNQLRSSRTDRNEGLRGRSSSSKDRSRSHVSRRKTSVSNHHNPRSNYRMADKTVHVGKTARDPKDGRGSGAVYHNRTNVVKHHVPAKRRAYRYRYYPTAKINVHVHPHTYRNHYKVLYYPRYSEIIWTRGMFREYRDIYPHYTNWHYHFGYRIQTISAFDAKYNIGEISRVYGRVYATWFNKETDDLLLFFGGEYPQQDFTLVVPGKIARRYSWRPHRYFLGQHIIATGLVTRYEGKPEMVIKKRKQLDVY